MSQHKPISRRRFLEAGAAMSAAGVLGAHGVAGAAANTVPGALPHVDAVPAGSGPRVLYRNAALADGRSDRLRTGISILVDSGRISWIRPSDSEGDPGPSEGLERVDARGATIVPGMVDAHSHLTSPGGANYIQRFLDPPAKLLDYAEANGKLALQAGIAWVRDVGSPTVVDPIDDRRRALALGIRDRWAGRNDRPKVRSAGTWLAPPGVLPSGLAITVSTADELRQAALRQLDQGADLVKLYVESQDPSDPPWNAAEIRSVVDAVHARGAKATAHAMALRPARAAVFGGVDAVEHGFRISVEVAREMAARGTFLVSTLTVPRSWLALGRTTTGVFWSTAAGRNYARALLNDGEASVARCRAAGVRIAAGTDFGGGSSRANQLAWEVGSLVTAGIEPWEALRAATWRGGQLLGEPDAGVVREGGPADFFLVHGDPLSDPSALWRVWRVA